MQTLALKRVLFVGGVSALICLTSTFSALANLLIDPSFEANTAASAGGWNIGGARSTAFSRTPATPPTGGHSNRLGAGGGNLSFEGPINPNLTNVTAGEKFDLTGYALVTNSIVSGFAGIQATFFGQIGGVTTNLGTVESGFGIAQFSNKIDSNNTTISTGVQGNQTWIPLDTGVFTAPANATYMDVYTISVNLLESNGSAGVWIDDLDLEVVPEPSSIALGAMGLIAGVSILARRRRSR